MTTTIKIVVSEVPLPFRTDLEKVLIDSFGDANIITVQHGVDASTYKLLDSAHTFQAWNGIPELKDACFRALDSAATRGINAELVYASTESFGIWTFKNAYIGYEFQECSGDVTPEGYPSGPLLAFLESQNMALNWN